MGTPIQNPGDATTQTALNNENLAGDSRASNLELKQNAAFLDFKEKCEAEGFTERPADLKPNDVSNGINDDASLLRFLIARAYNVSEAVSQFGEAHHIRTINSVCRFYDQIDIDAFEETRFMYPHWTGRMSRTGQPVCIFDMFRLDTHTVSQHRASSAAMPRPQPTSGAARTDILRSFAHFDHLTRFVMPLCTAAAQQPSPASPAAPVTSTLLLADVGSLSIAQLWNLKGYVLETNKLFATCFPEIIDRIFISGLPSFFVTLLNLAKRWIDEGTAAKLVPLAQEEVLPTLLRYIDARHIPRKFGGEMEFEHGMPLDLDERVKEALEWEGGSDGVLPRGPRKWAWDSRGRAVAVAVGSREGEARREVVGHLREPGQIMKGGDIPSSSIVS